MKIFGTSNIYDNIYQQTVAGSFPQLTVGMHGLLCFHPRLFVHHAVNHAECHAFKQAKWCSATNSCVKLSVEISDRGKIHQFNCVSSQRKATGILSTIKLYTFELSLLCYLFKDPLIDLEPQSLQDQVLHLETLIGQRCFLRHLLELIEWYCIVACTSWQNDISDIYHSADVWKFKDFIRMNPYGVVDGEVVFL